MSPFPAGVFGMLLGLTSLHVHAYVLGSVALHAIFRKRPAMAAAASAASRLFDRSSGSS
jgi:hypothetical protein